MDIENMFIENIGKEKYEKAKKSFDNLPKKVRYNLKKKALIITYEMFGLKYKEEKNEK